MTKKSSNETHHPITYERVGPTSVKIISSVNGSKKEIVARVATQGHYQTFTKR